METPFARAVLSPFGVDRPNQYLSEALRRHAASIEQAWIQPRGELTLPSDLRRQADAGSGLTLVLPGPLDLPTELRDRLYNFFENEAGVFLRVAWNSQLIEALLHVASLAEPDVGPRVGLDPQQAADLAALWNEQPPGTLLIENLRRDREWALLGSLETLQQLTASSTNPSSLAAACALEVERLHRFFEDWFTGAILDEDESFSPLLESLGQDFHIVTPKAIELARDELLERIRAAHGREKAGTFRIWTRLLSARPITEGLVLVRYEEWQERAGTASGRTSTALIEFEPNSKPRWRHVHETDLPESETTGDTAAQER